MSSGNTCSVINCANNSVKIQLWKKKICEIHKPSLHQACPCLLPYSLHWHVHSIHIYTYLAMSATNYLLPVSYGQKETSSLLLWVVGGGWLRQPAGCNFGREKGQGETRHDNDY